VALGRRIALTGLLAATCGFAAPAQSAVNGNVALRLTFTTPTPGASTGMHVDVRLGNPVGSDHKPLPLTGAVIQLPGGTTIATARRPQCSAPDPVLQAAGTLACPSDSQVGSGSLAADTGFGPSVDPLVGDDTVFNGKDELIEIVTPPGAPAPAAGVDHLTISGSTLTAHPPSVPGGPSDYKTDIKRINFVIPAHGTAGRSYISTPPNCPRTGRWRTVATFYFGDGTSNRVTADTPCVAP
jgi:hypothetical protein